LRDDAFDPDSEEIHKVGAGQARVAVCSLF